MTRTRLFATLTAVAVTSMAASLMAQSFLDATSKQRGAYAGMASQGAVSSARSYTEYYREYARATPTIEPAVARDAADAIGDYIAKAQKHMTWMRTEADKANDKVSLASLDIINTNLADAAKAHHQMHEMCMKDKIDKAGTMKCCEEIDASLAKVIDEHDKLMKRLGLPNPTVATK